MAHVIRNHPKLTLEGAQAVLAAAEKRAQEIAVPMNIAIVDDGGHLLAFSRQDGAKPSSAAIAINKAVSSAIRRGPSGPSMVNGEADMRISFALAIGSNAQQTPLRGGLPLLVEGTCVGAIGVSNGSEEQDMDVAQAGVRALVAT